MRYGFGIFSNEDGADLAEVLDEFESVAVVARRGETDQKRSDALIR